MAVGSCDLSLAEKKIIVVYKESTQVVLLRESDQIGFSGLLAKEVFEMKRTTLVYYLQNEPKCDQL